MARKLSKPSQEGILFRLGSIRTTPWTSTPNAAFAQIWLSQPPRSDLMVSLSLAKLQDLKSAVHMT